MSRIVTHNESTSQLIPSGYTSGGTYTFTWRNPTNAYYNADHSISIEASAIPTIPSFVKKNSQYKQVSKAYKKNGNVWEEKINNVCNVEDKQHMDKYNQFNEWKDSIQSRIK